VSLVRAGLQTGCFHPRGVQRASSGLRHCFRFAVGWCRPPASCGLHATPDGFRLHQRPLVISPGTRQSILSSGEFRRVRFSSPLARLSPCGSQLSFGPVTVSCVVTRRVLWSARYPCWLWPQQRLLTAYPPVRNPDLHPNTRSSRNLSLGGSGQVTKFQSRNAPACSVCRLPLNLSLIRAPLIG